jgi:large conductance mechanosensitive channel
MGLIKEFREFALRGNVVDLAVGVIIGAAFNKIVESVVNDLIMPIIGMFFNADFSSLYIPLKNGIPKGLPIAEARKLGPVLAWGNFISVVLHFIILAFVVFLLIKGINRLRRQKDVPATEPKAPEYTLQEKLLMEIRDSLKK